MPNEWFEKRQKIAKVVEVGLTKETAEQLMRLCRVSGYRLAEQAERLLPRAVEEALRAPEFLAAEAAKGGDTGRKHAGGRPPKAQAAGKE